MADIVPQARCGAQLRGKPGRFCQQFPIVGRTRCKLHGGLTPQGVESPHFVNGRRSRSLPTRLAAHYEDARRSPDLVQLRDDLAVMDALLTETLETLKDGSGEWKAARDAFDRVRQCMKAKDLTGAAAGMSDLGAVLDGSIAGMEARHRIADLVMVKRKLVDSEVKRAKTLFEMMSAEQAMVLVAALSAAVQEEVPDVRVQARIDAKFQRLLSAHEGKKA